jgi:hypothetical protein
MRTFEKQPSRHMHGSARGKEGAIRGQDGRTEYAPNAPAGKIRACLACADASNPKATNLEASKAVPGALPRARRARTSTLNLPRGANILRAEHGPTDTPEPPSLPDGARRPLPHCLDVVRGAPRGGMRSCKPSFHAHGYLRLDIETTTARHVPTSGIASLEPSQFTSRSPDFWSTPSTAGITALRSVTSV